MGVRGGGRRGRWGGRWGKGRGKGGGGGGRGEALVEGGEGGGGKRRIGGCSQYQRFSGAFAILKKTSTLEVPLSFKLFDISCLCVRRIRRL